MNTKPTHPSNTLILLSLSMLLSACADAPNTEEVWDGDTAISVEVNTAPEVSQVEVLATTNEDGDGDPTTAWYTDTLECIWDFEDAEGNADKSTVVWSAAGTVLAEGNAFDQRTLSGNFFGGEKVICTVTPDDGADAGTPVSGNIDIDVIIPPAISNLEVIATTDMDGDGDSSTAVESDELVCSYAFEEPYGEPNQSFLIWFVNGLPAIGNTTPTMSDNFSAGDTISCQVTADNGLAVGNTEHASIVIGDSASSGSAPIVTSVTISPDPAYAGDTLNCKYVYMDPDGDPDQSAIQWFQNGTSVGKGVSIVGKGFAVGDEIICEVTPFDGQLYGQIASDNVIISK
jgi:hypothetical protein